MIKEEINNVRHAIQWAKIDIINSVLLSADELAIIHDIFKDQDLTPLSIEEMLEFSHVSVLHNNTVLVYLIKTPILEKENFQHVIVRPVVKNNKIIHFNSNNFFIKDNQIYEIPTSCKSLNNITICNKNKIVNLSNTNCIPNLVKGTRAYCNFSNADHVEQVEEIDDGLVLLNAFDGNLTYNGTTEAIKGTYLIYFHNESICVNAQQFDNVESTISNPGVPTIQMTPEEIKQIKILSLQSLEALHVDNIGKLRNLANQFNTNRITLAILFLLAVIISFALHLLRRKKGNVTLQISQVPTQPIHGIDERSQNSIAQTTPCKLRQTPINDVPYF